MSASTTSGSGSHFADQGIFSPDSLEMNRSGRLTDVQRRQFVASDRSWRRGALGLAAVFAVIGVLVLTSTGPAPNAALRPVAGAVFLVIAAGIVFFSMPASDPLSRDIHDGRVEVLQGAMEKHTFSDRTVTAHYLDVADKHFEVGRAEYEAVPTAAFVKVYYLPHSHKVVNLELLPDQVPAGPGGAMNTPVDELKHLAVQMGTSRGEQHHEAAAELAGLGRALKAETEAAAVPPPVDQRDPRPLAVAIIGTWRAGPVSITFAEGGSLTMTTPGGQARQGHWSVDAAGRLHADALGHDETGDAWVTGDTLRLATGGTGMMFKRIPGA